MEIEFTQWRTFLSVKRSPRKTCPKWPSQRWQTISTRKPSGSMWRPTAPGEAEKQWDYAWEKVRKHAEVAFEKELDSAVKSSNTELADALRSWRKARDE